MRKRWSIYFVRGLHGFSASSGCSIFDQGHMVSKFHAKAACCFDAGVGDHANQHQPLDAMLLELLI